ncbi:MULTISPECIES: hypothetical protein [Planococcus]|uniref:Uncharacterized protein n=1 Tax=Planococcus faecalis TaxID=1598147 RepID=A0ABN4XHD2_9BACL|nr:MULTISPECIES: hypothetical protein [Planococcus]AQU78201.1 hypothetical protein AJGP001_02270 [Planococcus faecalis]MDJ0331161.1 hypothetical protein [Planococcus sp. S3-L1]OHX53797.1 hypothetical protein BB777_08710 [Planococcus faecalis]
MKRFKLFLAFILTLSVITFATHDNSVEAATCKGTNTSSSVNKRINGMLTEIVTLKLDSCTAKELQTSIEKNALTSKKIEQIINKTKVPKLLKAPFQIIFKLNTTGQKNLAKSIKSANSSGKGVTIVKHRQLNNKDTYHLYQVVSVKSQ